MLKNIADVEADLVKDNQFGSKGLHTTLQNSLVTFTRVSFLLLHLNGKSSRGTCIRV